MHTIKLILIIYIKVYYLLVGIQNVVINWGYNFTVNYVNGNNK